MVPPRSYPQPPPSNLPILLLGLARLFSWIAAGSAALVFIYHVRRPSVQFSTEVRVFMTVCSACFYPV
jgi:hypothetical protein